MNQQNWKDKAKEYIEINKRKRQWHRLTAILTAIVVVVTSATMIIPAVTMETDGSNSASSWATVSKPGYDSNAKNIAEKAPENSAMDPKNSVALQAETESYDFANDITNVTVERQQGNQWVQGDEFVNGDTIRVTLSYAIPMGVIDESQQSMHYQLPDGIRLENEETGDVYLEGGEKAGTFSISTDGLISIIFDTEFANGEAFSGNLHFQGSIALTNEGVSEEIQFGGDGGTITIIPEESEYNLRIAKNGFYIRDQEDADQYNDLKLNIETEQLIYYISVYSNTGTDGSDGEISIRDKFAHNPSEAEISYDEGNIVIYKRAIDINGNPTSVEMTDYNIEYSQQTGTDDTGNFNITGLPALGENEGYDVYYTAKLSGDTVKTSDGYISIKNNVTAMDNSQEVSAEATVEISRRMVDKEVQLNDGTGNLTWTVRLNEDGRNLSDMEFVDEMTYTFQGTQNSYNLENIKNIRVTAYELNDARDQVSKGDVTNAFSNLIVNDDGKMVIRFPSDGQWPEGLGTNWIYEIVYETPFPQEADVNEQLAFANTATLGEYTVTENWNGTVPKSGYGLTKSNSSYNLNTVTDIGTMDWQSTISYPSANFELSKIEYMDWIPDVYYDESKRLIQGSHYTTIGTLRDTLQIENALGNELIWGEDFTVSVLFTDDMLSYNTFDEAWDDMVTIFGQNLTEVTEESDAEKSVSMFCITFNESAQTKLQTGQRLYISYRTLVNRQGITDGNLLKIANIGTITGNTVKVEMATSFHQQLNKQISNTGMPPSGDDFNLDSDVYVDRPVEINLGDNGGRLYFRILFYNYGDSISFHDNLLEQFDGSWSVDQNMKIYDTTTGEVSNVKTWDYLDSGGRYQGNYQLNNLGQFRDCVIGLYYSIDVSGDEALAGLADGETYTYTNTVEWTGVSSDSTEAEVINGEVTLRKFSNQVNENGNNLVYYYVVINPKSRNLHPESNRLELQDNLTIPSGTSAILHPETIGLYHYDAQNEEGYYLGQEITDNEFNGFEVVKTEGAENSYTFTVPDEMACVVVYSYEIDIGTSALEEININNTASLMGRAVIPAGSDITIQAQESGAQVNKATLTIYKYGGEDVSNLLDGALFDLFRYEKQEDGRHDWVRTDLTAKGEEAEDGGTRFITGGDGVKGAIVLNFLEEADGNSSYYNTIYRLTEYKSIDGYVIDPTPRYYVWGENGITEEETALRMADDLREAGITWDDVIFIPFGQSKTDYIANESATTSITITKQWREVNGDEITADNLPANITLTLYQHVGDSKQEYGEQVIVTPDEYGRWTYTWDNLPKKDTNGNNYSYSVEENAIAGEVGTGDFKVSSIYPADGSADTGISSGEIIIINTKIDKFILPETGGVGLAPFIIAGLLLIVTSSVGYIYIKKK